jgi:hypothetical protein
MTGSSTQPGFAHRTPSPGARAINRRDQGTHLPNVKVGCQRLSGQNKTETMY